MTQLSDLSALLACALRSEDAVWPAALNTIDANQLAQAISDHGISDLLIDLPLANWGWPAALIEHVRDEARMQALWEASHRAPLAAVLEAMSAQGVEAVVLKGAALAYSLYNRPSQRRRGDSDILIRPSDRDGAREALRMHGFAADEPALLLQEEWHLHCSSGFTHSVDLHWSASNSPAISQALPMDLFFSGKQPLPGLSPSSFRPGAVAMLLNASINQASHTLIGMGAKDTVVDADRRLLWAMDYHLIASELAEADWQSLVRTAIDNNLAGVTGNALQLAQQCMHTEVPDWVLPELEAHKQSDTALRYFGAASARQRFDQDRLASRAYGGEFDVIRAHIMASHDLLVGQFPDAAHWPLWALRLRRLGALTWRYGTSVFRGQRGSQT